MKLSAVKMRVKNAIGGESNVSARASIACLLLLSAICTLAVIAASAAREPKILASRPSPAGATQNGAAQTYEGMLTDTHCGAKHSASIGMAAADCARACVHGGEHFALIDGDNVYVLEGELDRLKRVAGQRVRIVGSLNGITIAVSSVSVDR